MDTENLTPEVREYMRALGKKVTPEKLEALAENRKRLSDPEVRARMRAAQQARRDRERQDGTLPPPPPTRPRGRPKQKKEEGSKETT